MVIPFFNRLCAILVVATSLSIFPLFFVIAQDCYLPHFQKEKFTIKDEQLIRADELFSAGLHHRAIPAYKEILQDVANKIETTSEKNEETQLNTAMQSRFHLAQAYFVLESYKEALDALHDNINEDTSLQPKLNEIRQNSIYLAALIYKKTEQYDCAQAMLSQYLKAENPFNLPLHDEALFEIGLINFLKGNLNEAKNQFEALNVQQFKPRLHTLIQLYLARIQLTQANYGAAATSLASLAKQIPPHDELHFELSYLQGEAFFQMHDYRKALEFFNFSLPNANPEKCSWYCETLYHCGWCYLKLCDDPLINQNAKAQYFTNAESIFQKLLNKAPEERVYLALGQCYLFQAREFKNKLIYARAEDLLARQDLFSSRDGQSHALLLRAEAAPSYAARDKLYQQLTQEINKDSPYFAKGWYLRALNDFEEGQVLLQNNQIEEAQKIFEKSAAHFHQAFLLLKNKDKSQAGSSLKYQALAIGCHRNREANLKAVAILEELINDYPDLLYALDNPDEIFYLHGFFAARLIQTEEKFASISEQSLKHAAAFPNCKFGDIALAYLGASQYRNGFFSEAETTYLKITKDFPNSQYADEAWFWAACCADKLQRDPEISRQYRRNVFEKFPLSSYAAEAYFTLYDFRDYLQGDRIAIKHLQNFAKKYPETPFLMQAFYLIGLDYKRDRQTAEGKWLRKKSLTDAIDAFQEVETLFDTLIEKELIPSDKLDYYITIRYRAILERAMANLAIAEESQGAKQQIYLEYAEEVFKRLVDDFHNIHHPHIKLLLQEDAYPPLYEESYFWLAQTYIKGKNDEAAKRTLSQMVDHYQQNKITRGYHLSRVWYELGKIAIRGNEFAAGQQFFKNAEDAAKGNVLGTEQRLDLWIQQSMCHRGLDQLDDAILILSKVVNDDAVSSLRLKAMYLRAEIYELQERPELACKQLESIAKKGGIWAAKAKEKLEKEYGN